MPDHVAAQRLRDFAAFENLPEDELLVVASKTSLLQSDKGAQLFACGDVGSHEYFLLQGKIKLTAEDGRERLMSFDDNVAQHPVARLRPRQYAATAHTEIEYFTIDVDLLELVSQQNRGEPQGVEVSFDVSGDEQIPLDESGKILASFKTDLEANQFVLTSLPEVAIKIRELMDDENVAVKQVAELINRDPVIATKLMKAANSPVYYGTKSCESVNNAIVRLGLLTTRQLVISFTIKDLFTSKSSLLKKHMAEAWRESTNIAALSFVMAQYAGDFNAEEAMLAGLVSNIGVISTLDYLQRYPEILKDGQRLQLIVDSLKGEIGVMVLEHWSFGEEMIAVARHCGDWQRESNPGPDLCDLVIMATLHSYIGARRQPTPPVIDSVPAFDKLSLGQLTPRKTLQILDEAKEQIENAQQLLSV